MNRKILLYIPIFLCLHFKLYAQVELKDFYFGFNCSTIFQSSEYSYEYVEWYTPFFGANAGIVFSYPVNDKIKIDIPVNYEHQRILNRGIFDQYQGFSDSLKGTFIYNNAGLSVYPKYKCSDKIWIGLGLIYNFRFTSHYKMSKKQFEEFNQNVNHLEFLKYKINELSKNNLGYSITMDYSLNTKTTFFVRFSQLIDFLHYSQMPVKQYQTSIVCGISISIFH